MTSCARAKGEERAGLSVYSTTASGSLPPGAVAATSARAASGASGARAKWCTSARASQPWKVANVTRQQQ